MFSRYNSSPQGHAAVPSPSCSWRVGRVGSVATGIWNITHPPQISPTHISGHPSLRIAHRLSISHLHSANIFLGQSIRNGPLMIKTGGTTVTCRKRTYSTSPKAICPPVQCFSRISKCFPARKAGQQYPSSSYRDFTK